MAHIRLDDKRFELSMAEPRVRTGSAVLLPALGSAAAPVDWECPTMDGNRALLSTEPLKLATLEVVTEGVSKASVRRLRAPLAHIGHGQHISVVTADDSDSPAVRFRGAKVIFRSEPEIVDADGATDLLVIQDC